MVTFRSYCHVEEIGRHKQSCNDTSWLSFSSPRWVVVHGIGITYLWYWDYISEDPVCTWRTKIHDKNSSIGIFCKPDNTTVDAIQLNDNNLRGTLPWELVLLTNLELINIADNNISGSIPSRIHELSHLKYFYASRNDITGSLPTTFPQRSKIFFCMGI